MALQSAAALKSQSEPLLEARDVDVCVAGHSLVSGLSFQLQRGQLVCLLGANGAGKSLTLHTLAGLRSPSRGEVLLNGTPIARWPRRERALRIGLLTQVSEDPFPGTVMEAVLVGRHPHVHTWQWESSADLEVARKALMDCDLEGFEARELDTLSGGERRRVALAAVLAQDPDVLLLDEPQNHLDPRHQLSVLRLLRARADVGKSVIVSLHDASLASRFADQALLLNGDGRWSFGSTQTTLTAAQLTDLYEMPVTEVALNGQRHFLSQ